MVSEVDLNNTVTEGEREEMENELTKLEEEITTLKQVLASKEKRHLELKQKLGITPLCELRQNFTKSWYDMQTSTAYDNQTTFLLSCPFLFNTAVPFSSLCVSAVMRCFRLKSALCCLKTCCHNACNILQPFIITANTPSFWGEAG
uniref:Tpd52 like 1 n=1 Tax=Sinocyclocheilus grahami TaxID=75366 RepID=A0A672S2E7_SINGR